MDTIIWQNPLKFDLPLMLSVIIVYFKSNRILYFQCTNIFVENVDIPDNCDFFLRSQSLFFFI